MILLWWQFFLVYDSVRIVVLLYVLLPVFDVVSAYDTLTLNFVKLTIFLALECNIFFVIIVPISYPFTSIHKLKIRMSYLFTIFTMFWRLAVYTFTTHCTTRNTSAFSPAQCFTVSKAFSSQRAQNIWNLRSDKWWNITSFYWIRWLNMLIMSIMSLVGNYIFLVLICSSKRIL